MKKILLATVLSFGMTGIVVPGVVYSSSSKILTSNQIAKKKSAFKQQIFNKIKKLQIKVGFIKFGPIYGLKSVVADLRKQSWFSYAGVNDIDDSIDLNALSATIDQYASKLQKTITDSSTKSVQDGSVSVTESSVEDYEEAGDIMSEVSPRRSSTLPSVRPSAPPSIESGLSSMGSATLVSLIEELQKEIDGLKKQLDESLAKLIADRTARKKDPSVSDATKSILDKDSQAMRKEVPALKKKDSFVFNKLNLLKTTSSRLVEIVQEREAYKAQLEDKIKALQEKSAELATRNQGLSDDRLVSNLTGLNERALKALLILATSNRTLTDPRPSRTNSAVSIPDIELLKKTGGAKGYYLNLLKTPDKGAKEREKIQAKADKEREKIQGWIDTLVPFVLALEKELEKLSSTSSVYNGQLNLSDRKRW